MWPFTKKEKRSIENTTSQTLEQIILGIPVSEITPQNILEIPAVSACLERITSIAASLPLKLYKE
ncbi:MAG TPA: phage portal protein, partial [Clostridiaceae bacterium]|nr:phage portal protein [Clostridiaceae bacterium]